MNHIPLRGITAAVFSVWFASISPAAWADTTDDLVQALMAKGVLTEEEGALLLKGRSGEKQAAEDKKKSEVKASFKDGIVFESADGKHGLAVNGRLHADYRYFDYDESDTGTNTSTSYTFSLRVTA